MPYNGYSNWETWNVALWILNDQDLYSIAMRLNSYAEFRLWMAEHAKSETTGDGVRWTHEKINTVELDSAIWEGDEE